MHTKLQTGENHKHIEEENNLASNANYDAKLNAEVVVKLAGVLQTLLQNERMNQAFYQSVRGR